MSKYPRIVYNGSGSEKRKTCRMCPAKTLAVLCIEWNQFRGEDDVYKICKGCQKQLKADYGTDDVDGVRRAIDQAPVAP